MVDCYNARCWTTWKKSEGAKLDADPPGAPATAPDPTKADAQQPGPGAATPEVAGTTPMAAPPDARWRREPPGEHSGRGGRRCESDREGSSPLKEPALGRRASARGMTVKLVPEVRIENLPNIKDPPLLIQCRLTGNDAGQLASRPK